MALNVTHRVSLGDRFQQHQVVDRPRRTSMFNRGANGIAQVLSRLCRRLALATFLGTVLATYLVHRSAAASVTAHNLDTIIVMLIGVFVTIVLCAGSVALSSG
jgi:hypothetical protein